MLLLKVLALLCFLTEIAPQSTDSTGYYPFQQVLPVTPKPIVPGSSVDTYCTKQWEDLQYEFVEQYIYEAMKPTRFIPSPGNQNPVCLPLVFNSSFVIFELEGNCTTLFPPDISSKILSNFDGLCEGIMYLFGVDDSFVTGIMFPGLFHKHHDAGSMTADYLVYLNGFPKPTRNGFNYPNFMGTPSSQQITLTVNEMKYLTQPKVMLPTKLSLEQGGQKIFELDISMSGLVIEPASAVGTGYSASTLFINHLLVDPSNFDNFQIVMELGDKGEGQMMIGAESSSKDFTIDYGTHPAGEGLKAAGFVVNSLHAGCCFISAMEYSVGLTNPQNYWQDLTTTSTEPTT